MDEMAVLNGAATQVGRQTTPARDLEVIVQELEQRGFPKLAQVRGARLSSSYDAIVSGMPLKQLMAALDAWPVGFRLVEFDGRLEHIQRQIRKTLGKQAARLHAAIEDVQFDRHELRILVKRTRYLTEAFPSLSPLSKSEAKLLKGLQSALGDWHDHYQWCQRALIEKDLLPLQSACSECAATALQKTEVQLSEVAKQLPKSSGKKKPPKVAAEERARV
jgi:CHAD domain-containing protein